MKPDRIVELTPGVQLRNLTSVTLHLTGDEEIISVYITKQSAEWLVLRLNRPLVTSVANQWLKAFDSNSL